MSDKLNTYSHIEHCRNCGHTNFVDIPKGQTISEHLRSVYCSNCGVGLRSSPYERRERDVWLGATHE